MSNVNAVNNVLAGYTSANNVIFGDVEFTEDGSYTWVVPDNVYYISAVCVGAGGSGGSSIGGGSYSNWAAGGGGGGGGLSWENRIAVTPGETLYIVVGRGTTGSSTISNSGTASWNYAEESSIKRGSTYLLHAEGGAHGAYYRTTVSQSSGYIQANAPGGKGGNDLGYEGGDYGGNGGKNITVYDSGSLSSLVPKGGGGGGAAGYKYTSKGGGAGGLTTVTTANPGSTNGFGGGAGGATATGGGGVGIYGRGYNGIGGISSGKGGSRGQSGTEYTAGVAGRGGSPGGGGGGLNFVKANGGGAGGAGGDGAVRIIWGLGRSFPDNARPAYEEAIGAFDLDHAVLEDTYSTRARPSFREVTGIFFKPDGTAMYVIDKQLSYVNMFNLSTAWDVSSSEIADWLYLGSLSASITAEVAEDIFFAPDGTKMYISGNNSYVYQFDLSSAWDLTSADLTYIDSVYGYENIPKGAFFKPDGTKMYVVGSANSNGEINEFTLSPPWSVNNSTFTRSKTFSSYIATVPEAVFFKDDGTRMYVLFSHDDDVNEYSLSTAWDISTASYVQNFSVASQETSPTGLFFKDDGTKMYVAGTSGDDVNEYSLSTAWDISTASYVQKFYMYYTASTEIYYSLFFKDDGTSVYFVSSRYDTITQFNLGTPWEVTTASETPTYTLDSGDAAPRDLFFKPDGTVMWILADGLNDLREYTLSTAWDISTATYNGYIDVNLNPDVTVSILRGIFFKPDGTRMYLLCDEGTIVYILQWELTTPWDIFTRSYLGYDSLSSAANVIGSNPASLRFSDDGTKIFVVDSTNKTVLSRNLATAWDITSTSIDKIFEIDTTTTVGGIFFKPGGRRMYISDSGPGMMQYKLGRV